MDRVRTILTKISKGKMVFQVISSEAAEMMCIPGDQEIMQAEEGELYALARQGLIKIANHSAAGFITVDRITQRGLERLAPLRSDS